MHSEEEFKQAVSFIWKLHVKALILGVVMSIMVTEVYQSRINFLPGIILTFLLYKFFFSALKWVNYEDQEKFEKVVNEYLDEHMD